RSDLWQAIIEPMSSGLAERFMSRFRGADDSSAGTPEPLGAALGHALAEARLAWPDFAVGDDAFVDHLADHCVGATDPVAAVRGLHAADMLLAVACAAGEIRAIAAFERDVLPEAASALKRMKTARDLIGEVQQQLRDALFVGAPGRPPLITRYGGRGPLRAW